MWTCLGDQNRSRYFKFFRGLIANSQPAEIDKIIKQYEKSLEAAEIEYIDILLHSNGALNYIDIMTMPVKTINTLVSRLNHITEEKNKALSSAK
jgi:hypothetical protein